VFSLPLKTWTSISFHNTLARAVFFLDPLLSEVVRLPLVLPRDATWSQRVHRKILCVRLPAKPIAPAIFSRRKSPGFFPLRRGIILLPSLLDVNGEV